MTEKLTVTYQVSTETLKKELIATGRLGKNNRQVEFELETLDPATREKLFKVGALKFTSWGSLSGSCDIRSITKWTTGGESKEQIFFDGEPTIDQVIEVVKIQREAEAEAKSIKAAAKELEEALKIELEGLKDAEEEKINQAWERQDEGWLKAYQVPEKLNIDSQTARNFKSELFSLRNEKYKLLTEDREQKERENWIREHGSEHLKKATAEGFLCKRIYVIERAAAEASDFEVDYFGAAKYEKAYCPTHEALLALDEARTLGLGDPVIVRLSRPGDNSEKPDYPEDFEEKVEAVMIEDFLGEYDLIRIIG
jgi:hypothetical protein